MRTKGFEFCGAVAAAAALFMVAGLLETASANDGVFTIGNYPVEASAANAVTAKRNAINDGRQAAFRSLMKRIVPVTAYGRLKGLETLEPQPFVAGVAVKAERNSGTRYIATLDFSFSPDAVRNELRRRAIPFVDTAAPQATIVVIYSPPRAGAAGATRDMSAAEGGAAWRGIWADLDLKNTLTPLKLAKRSKHLRNDVILKVAAGDQSAMRILNSEYNAEQVVLAISEPDPEARRLNVVLAGRDAVGPFALKRRYRIDPDDFVYSLELAAVVSLGIIEGRWKAVQNPGAAQAAGGGLQPVRLWVEFRDLAQWQQRQRLLSELPGVERFETGDLSVRGASVALSYPGGGERLRDALTARGHALELQNGTWIMR